MQIETAPRALMDTVMAGGKPARVPYRMGGPQELHECGPRAFWEWLRQQTGREPGELYHLDLGIRMVNPRWRGLSIMDPPFDMVPDDPSVQGELRERFQPYLAADLPPGFRVTEMGGMSALGSDPWLRCMIYPVAELDRVEEWERFPLPDVNEPWRWEGFDEAVRRLHAQGYWVATDCATPIGGIFDSAWTLFGQEKFLADLYVNPELAEAVLDRLTDVTAQLFRRAAAGGVDCLAFVDDLANQKGLVMKPEMLRRWILSRWERVFAEARAANPQVRIRMHTDGRIQTLIPDLLAIGVDALNPIQPELDDPEELKTRFPRLVLDGCVASLVLTFGTPQDVAAEVKCRMETAKRWGGMVIAPNNYPDRDTPFENFKAFLDAAEEYGQSS